MLNEEYIEHALPEISHNPSNSEYDSFLRNISSSGARTTPTRPNLGSSISIVSTSTYRSLYRTPQRFPGVGCFLALTEHLLSASNTQIGTQIMAMVRERASAVAW